MGHPKKKLERNAMQYVLKRYPTLAPALALAAAIGVVVFVGGIILGFIPPVP